MPIELKYGNPASLIGAGYAAGQGQARARQQRELLPIIQQRDNLRAQQNYDWMRRQQEQGWDAARQQAGFDQQARLQDRAFGHQEDLQGNLFDQQQQLADERNQMVIDRQMVEGLRRGQLEYTPAQEQQIARWQEAASRVTEDPTLDDEQREYAMNELNHKIQSVRPMPKRPDQHPRSVADRVNEDLHWDESGTPWTVTKDGELQVPRGWKQPQAADNSKADEAQRRAMAEDAKHQLDLQQAKARHVESLLKMTTERQVGDKVTVENTYTPDQAWAEAERRFGGSQSGSGQGVGGVEASPQIQSGFVGYKLRDFYQTPEGGKVLMPEKGSAGSRAKPFAPPTADTWGQIPVGSAYYDSQGHVRIKVSQ